MPLNVKSNPMGPLTHKHIPQTIALEPVATKCQNNTSKSINRIDTNFSESPIIHIGLFWE